MRSRGQVIPLIAAGAVGMLAMSAIVIDAGNIYSAHQQLVAASNAAALAGAYDVPNVTTATIVADATKFSATTGNNNAHSQLNNVSIAVSEKCLSSVGVPCVAPPGSVIPINAVQVTEHASVHSFFGGVLGFLKFPVTATATAVPRSGTSLPANVVLVLDTTQSMTTKDTNCTVSGITGPTREQCAQAAVRTLMLNLDPCYVGLTTCGAATGGTVTNAVDQVAMMVFPGLTPSQTKTLSNPPVQAPTATDDYQCPSSNPSITSYNNNPGYLVLPFQSNYRGSDGATTLNASAQLVVASGGGSCAGMGDPGGEGTFYAGAIDAAQTYLTSNAKAQTENVMILLSDGNATASSTEMKGSATSYSSSNECHQAVTEAQKARAAGTLIYTVAYGAESSGCTSDSPSITPCSTMENIASTPITTYFFSDASQSGGGVDPTCVNNSRPITNLQQAFAAIAGDLTVARLVPNTAT
jgi:putative Flp pilus-assembly TadE/G-like protein